ncbi:hypothetical protein EK21DRAFT_119022 [Setomelanomma holmii]|uniref:Uncharacterized protein n=1 Tax=Setomelanomma holmii TaxID=210430 RepID=A0A9P4LFH9_9PLEO|nr:hypothetical protein EK21DRAFT_119022 [Setomelanomma holmii]
MSDRSSSAGPDAQPFAISSLACLLKATRASLLSGPTPLIIAMHTGEDFDYARQCAAANDVVSVDRMRQLIEQAHSGNRPFVIECHADALAIASPSFKQLLESNSNTTRIDLNLGRVLPGYAMCVPDWYGRALRSKLWHDFLTDEPSVQGDDKWYWVYCYAEMCSMAMDEIAMDLKAFIQDLIELLAPCLTDYAHFLRTL